MTARLSFTPFAQRTRRVLLTMTVVVAGALFSAPSRASNTRAVAPAGGGIDAIEATIDPRGGTIEVRQCKSADCSDSGGAVRSIPIPIDRPRLDLAGASIAVLPIGEGRSALHVRIADAQRKDLAFEAILAGKPEPIYAGLTGYTRGEEGDRSGDVVLVYDRDEHSKFVLVAETREDTRICGQATTPLLAKGLDPKTLELRGATLHRLDKKERDDAARLVATARTSSAKGPLGSLLVATGGSAPNTPALTDGNAETTWSEKRPGDGHGEFATMRAPSELPIHAVVLTVAPSVAKNAKSAFASPRTFFVATDQKLFHVTMPEDAWASPGKTYEIALPEPVHTTCIAIVLDEAYARGLVAPEVGLAEVGAITKFDVEGATLDDVAKALGGPRADEAVALLRRSNDAGLTAVVKVWKELDGRGRSLAVDVAASTGTCGGPAMDLLTRALGDKESEVRKRALGRIERCGKAAAESLTAAVRSDDEARRAASAPLLATIAPRAAIDPISEELGRGTAVTRHALRAAFTRAAAHAPRDMLLALFAKEGASPQARIDLLRALGPELAELRPQSSAAIAAVLGSSPDMATRWLIAQPLAELARSPSCTPGELTRLAEMARHDPEWPVRARAIELSADNPRLAEVVVASANDPEPRVREAAFRAIALGKIPSGRGAAAKALAKDPWTFVRIASASALGSIPGNEQAIAPLENALEDASPKVRAAAIAALGSARSQKSETKISDRLDDAREDIEVRAIAARTLGALCTRSATDRLTKLAQLARSPLDETDDRLGVAAIDALAALHPIDLDKRLAPLRGKDVRTPVRRAAERALTEPGACR